MYDTYWYLEFLIFIVLNYTFYTPVLSLAITLVHTKVISKLSVILGASLATACDFVFLLSGVGSPSRTIS